MAEQKIQFCLGMYHKVQSYIYIYIYIYIYMTALYVSFPSRTGFWVLPSVLQSSATVLAKSSSALLVWVSIIFNLYPTQNPNLPGKVDENKLGLSCRCFGVWGMDGFGGGDTYTYRTELYVSFPGRTIFLFCLAFQAEQKLWFCLGKYHKVQSYIYM